MDKSYFLDELRLEIGLVREQVQTLSSFYIGITRKFATIMDDRSSVSIFVATDRDFVMKVCAGPCYVDQTMPFGEGILSEVAIKGDLLFQIEKDMQIIYLPFYKSHHLLGVMVFYISLDSYVVSDDDFIFIKEVGRFIEVQHETFYPHTY
ncbi:hypothetical protein [Halalkalibacter okhensis]|uniref:GAF domain-containing protein n=1 Tax=Halalkalibacter okhensis TaxID=333138 RepID=A0A0B0IE40_9BACI|nr:hypothetical protein [Halalkalibacter okhensis]KHF40838.1 hypothetical protein LQ50_07000 [Halalkalibacter okhensis]